MLGRNGRPAAGAGSMGLQICPFVAAAAGPQGPSPHITSTNSRGGIMAAPGDGFHFARAPHNAALVQKLREKGEKTEIEMVWRWRVAACGTVRCRRC